MSPSVWNQYILPAHGVGKLFREAVSHTYTSVSPQEWARRLKHDNRSQLRYKPDSFQPALHSEGPVFCGELIPEGNTELAELKASCASQARRAQNKATKTKDGVTYLVSKLGII